MARAVATAMATAQRRFAVGADFFSTFMIFISFYFARALHFHAVPSKAVPSIQMYSLKIVMNVYVVRTYVY